MSAATDSARAPVVLLVEDNADHVFLATMAIEDAGVRADLHHVTNGEMAMMFLRRQGSYESAPTPDLVFLDINMPRMNGFEVMAAVRSDPALGTLPVTVLTTSLNPADEVRMRALGCNDFLRKPDAFDQLGARVLRAKQGERRTCAQSDRGAESPSASSCAAKP